MKTNINNRFKVGIDFSSDGTIFNELDVVEHDIKLLIELEITIFDAPIEIYYRVSDDDYIQLLDAFLNKSLKIFAQYKCTSANLKEDLKRVLREYIYESSFYYGQPRFLNSGFLDESDFNEIINDIKVNNKNTVTDSQKNTTPLIEYIRSLDLEIMPKGDKPENWIAKCPNGGKHFIMISTINDKWGCGYCNKSGNLSELKRWVNELTKKAKLMH